VDYKSQPRTESSRSTWERVFAIPASGIVFAAGGAMLGSAVGGPIGGVVGITLGGLSGAAVEIVSQKRHEKGRENWR